MYRDNSRTIKKIDLVKVEGFPEKEGQGNERKTLTASNFREDLAFNEA